MARAFVRVDPAYGLGMIVRFESYANFYRTNPVDDSSAISMTAWNASVLHGWRPDGAPFFPNKANAGFGNDFNATKITRLFSSSKPTGDCSIVSVVSRTGSEHRAPLGDLQNCGDGPGLRSKMHNVHFVSPSGLRGTHFCRTKPMGNSRDVSMKHIPTENKVDFLENETNEGFL